MLNERLSRRFRDRLAIAMESHIARLQATVATIEHQERPDYLDRLAVLRDTSFTLDHLFLSLLANVALVLRLRGHRRCCSASIHPALALLAVRRLPAVLDVAVAARRRAGRRGVGRRRTTAWPATCSSSAPRPAPAKEVRVTGIGDVAARNGGRAARERVPGPSPRPAGGRRCGTSLAWAVFGLAYVGGIVWVARGLDRSVGDIVLVVVAGAAAVAVHRPSRSASSASCAASGSTRRCA